MDLSIVIPVYNNSNTLIILQERLRSTLATLGGSWQAIYVDDRSNDGSLEILRSLAGRDPRVTVVPLQDNRGQSRAVLSGLSQTRGQRIVVMDADLQDPPEAIPELVRRLGGGADVVFAGRRGSYQSGWRLLQSRIFKRLLWLLSYGRLPADAGMFLAMDQRVATWLRGCQCQRPYLLSLLARSGARMVSVPVERMMSERSNYDTCRRLALAIQALMSMLGFGCSGDRKGDL